MLNNTIWENRTVFFITRIFILMGMMLVFSGVAYSVAVAAAKSIWGVDFINNATLYTQFTDEASLKSLKLLQALVSIGAFILPAWFFAKSLQQAPIDYLKLNRKTTFTEIGLTFLLVFASMPMVSWLIYINEKITLPASLYNLEQQFKQAEELAAQLTQAFVNANDTKTLMINLVIVAILPAIGEELLFRGVLQTFVRHVTGKKHLAVWVVAFVFSAFHGQFYGFIPRFVLGAVLGYAFLLTGNLWLSIMMHFLNNALAVITSYQPIKSKLPNLLHEGYVFESWLINFGSALATLALLWVLFNVTKKRVWYNGE